MAIDYQELIPNNVDLGNDRRLQRALENWHPKFLDWWRGLGPDGFMENEVYLRTATSVDAEGWATYGSVLMPDYRWGIFLADATPNRTIGFGDNFGKPAWQEVPGEHRAALRRLIVTQGDTEPASVEQQRLLGHTCPSLYDLRNLFQVNVEEGRHLWAMVYLLQAYFGRDGREEAEALLQRHSGDPDNPRILGTFNEPVEDWLSFFCFTYFTDRDGKFQLQMLAESGFDPLARTCSFMLTEEAHHMFVGETGLTRVIRRAAEVVNELGTLDADAIRNHGAIDLQTMQKYINFWFSSSLDLFGADLSTNAANYWAAGIKGRPNEGNFEDNVCVDTTMEIEKPGEDGMSIVTEEVTERNAMNTFGRRAYIRDSAIGLKRWNRVLSKAGVEFELTLPHERFRRDVGLWAGFHFDVEGNPMTAADWNAREHEWLPSSDDRAFVKSLMQQVIEPGKMAGWIAPPDRGINALPIDYEYVKL